MTTNTTTTTKSRTTTSKPSVKSASKKKFTLKAGQLLTGKNSVFRAPATGGYIGGRRTGEAIAISLLKELRESDSDRAFMRAGDIARAFAIRLNMEGGEAMRERPVSEWSTGYNTVYGQYSGFLEVLGEWAVSAAKNLGRQLDAVSDEELLGRMNAGINLDEDAYMRAYIDGIGIRGKKEAAA